MHQSNSNNICFFNSISYFLPTKLSEGNAFSRVCVSFCLQGWSHVTITHNTLDLNVQGPPPPNPTTSPTPTWGLACVLWSTYGWQVGGSHPPGLLTFVKFYSIDVYNVGRSDRMGFTGADPGGARGPGPPPDPRFWGPKIEHFWALFNFSIIFFCLASLGILFL